ncbi:MAG: hypothetical protein FJX75_11950 [Armatimonadetes bacterium]|nr:hypothetical protein [Armatimonadota bacterium]
MSIARKAAMLLAACAVASVALANGGPFVVKYPDGDPAAKGVLARLGPELKPTRETRLRVVKEDLSITFGRERFEGPRGRKAAPLAFVSAAYAIENPTDQEVQVDFGFPVLRGMYIYPYAMVPRPDVQVTLGDSRLQARVISNSAIYGIIRQGARRAIDRGLAADRKLAERVQVVGEADAATVDVARQALTAYLTDTLTWTERDAALMVEYARLDLGVLMSSPRDRDWAYWVADDQLLNLIDANLGPLSAIGEQKATQFLAQLASRFEPETAAAYEAIFTAWGGDVRERSVDLTTGEVRPREITLDPTQEGALEAEGRIDPTIYARVDYFDETAQISEADKASCKAILRNLPVIFTFAPMNLIHYSVTFPAAATSELTVRYSQYAYRDTRDPASYQLAYVVHPASMWDEFGPINLEVVVPEGVACRVSTPCGKIGTEERKWPGDRFSGGEEAKRPYDVYRAVLREKTGELFVAVGADTWHERVPDTQQTAQGRQTQGGQ